MIPVGVKAINQWDKIEESSKKVNSDPVPFVNVTYSKRSRKSNDSSLSNSIVANKTESFSPKKSLCDVEKTLYSN